MNTRPSESVQCEIMKFNTVEISMHGNWWTFQSGKTMTISCKHSWLCAKFHVGKKSSQNSVFCSAKKIILTGVSVNPEYVRFEELTFFVCMANL